VNTQWLIVIVVVIIFALGGIMGALYLNSAQILPGSTVMIDDTAPPMGSAGCLLCVAVEGKGTVIIDPYKEVYEPGETVTLEAVAASGHSFCGWEGAASSQELSVRVTMDDARVDVTAVFSGSTR
jgi:uncharacterized cupin superfamily protein